MNENLKKKINVLNYWIDIESSTPPTIRTSNFTNKSDSKWNQTISFKHKDDLLWSEPLKSNIEDPLSWVHKVFLGIFNTKHVISEFSSEDLSEVKSTHDTCLVSFLVDGKGVPIKDTIRIPDYLKSIAMTTIEDNEKAKLFDVRIQDIFATWSHGIRKSNVVLDTDLMKDFLHKILIELNWNLLADALVDGGFKSLGYSESINLKNLKEGAKPNFDTNDITSSLIVSDLKKVKKGLDFNILSEPLNKYLSEETLTAKDKIDVVKDSAFLREMLEIEKLPLSSWPFEKNKPLVASQQLIVNNFFDKIDYDYLLSVNGAPGTGKTTLVKDLVANIIFLRAEKMLKFKNDPKKAFKKIGETSLQINSKSIQEIYSVNEAISGYEILVASSNNGAVENITKELPLMSEINSQFHEYKYLSEIATNMNKDDSWGLLSASLGNKKNNFDFYSNFLHSKTTDTETTRSIFDYLSNPNYFEEKRLSWEDACENLERKIAAVKSIKNKTISIRKDVENYRNLYNTAVKSKTRCGLLMKRFNEEKLSLTKKISNLKSLKIDLELKKDEFNKAQNSFFKASKVNVQKMLEDLKTLEQKMMRLKKSIQIDKSNLNERMSQYKVETERFKEFKVSIERLRSFYDKYVKNINQTVPFDSFWEQDNEDIQKASPWHSNQLKEARSEVFMASLELHKAFMIENSKEISSNINAFKQVLNGSFYEDERLTRAVWETLFLIIPVISTTFSSLGNLFEDLLPNSIGWLIIDESGQATPQAPVGALWRSQRAFLLGDPLQVMPVVEIEDKLSDVLLKKNLVEKTWSSTMLSAQEIADRQNKYGTNIDLGVKKWVGTPLRVHRRCDEPMFSISNKIAYDNFMIFGKKRLRKKTYIEEILGKTSWIDVDGEPDGGSHWVPDEGKEVIRMLNSVCNSEHYKEKGFPKIYLITPFKNISFELKRLLKKEKNAWIPKSVNDPESKLLDNWLSDSIGTIHSFQGNETDVVFLILGGNIARPGAISWVCDKPNILNVATTRAINTFYIIGNRKIWNKGVFGLIKGFIKCQK